MTIAEAQGPAESPTPPLPTPGTNLVHKSVFSVPTTVENFVFLGPRPLGACSVCLPSIDRMLHVTVNRGRGTYVMCNLLGMR